MIVTYRVREDDNQNLVRDGLRASVWFAPADTPERVHPDNHDSHIDTETVEREHIESSKT